MPAIPADWMSTTTHYRDDITAAAQTTGPVVSTNASSWLCDMNNSAVWQLEYPVCTTKYNSIVVFVVVCAVLSVITLWTIFGNALVLVALYKYGTLRTMSNCLIGNLAISDLLLATTVLPISIGNDLLGYWVFGELACTMWLLVDVLYCTASVWGLCTVAFDRYLATVYPVWYHDQRSVEKAVGCIVFVWIFSFVISFAPVIGWQDTIPKFFTFNSEMDRYECVLFMSSSYVIYSATGSFIIPMCLMTFMYIRIFTVLHSKSKQLKQKIKRKRTPHKKKHKNRNGSAAIPKPADDTNTGVVRDITTTTLMSVANETEHNLMETDTILTIPAITIDVATFSKPPRNHSTDVGYQSSLIDANGLNSSSDSVTSNGHLNKLRPCMNPTMTDDDYKMSRFEQSSIKKRSQSVSVHGSPSISESGSISILNVSDLERRNSYEGAGFSDTSDSGNKNSLTPNSLFLNPVCHRSKSANTLSISVETKSSPAPRLLSRRSLPCDLTKFGRNNRMTQSMKRRFELREQRATKRMLLIMACFIVCWMPFVGMYISRSFCSTCSMNQHFVAAIIWLGYMNSSLNPVIYSLFNDDFKTAFRKLLGFKPIRQKHIK